MPRGKHLNGPHLTFFPPKFKVEITVVITNGSVTGDFGIYLLLLLFFWKNPTNIINNIMSSHTHRITPKKKRKKKRK